MLKRLGTLLIVLAGLLLSTPSSAQMQLRAVTQPEREVQLPLADVQGLTRLLVCLRDQKPPDCEADPNVPALLTKYRLGQLVTQPGESALRYTIGTTDAHRDAFLISAHVVYKDFKRKALADRRAAAGDAAIERAIESQSAVRQLGSQIHERLGEVGLNPPLNAILRGGYTLADAGDEFPKSLETGAPPLQNGTLGFIEFESKHFGDDSPLFDFSFGGSFGLGPALVIATRRPAEAEEAEEEESEPVAPGGNGTENAKPPVFVPAMMTGLAWSLNARPNMRVGGQSELSLLGRFGQTRLDELTVKLGDGDDAALADVVRNGTGRWAWFQEVGLEFRIFEKPLNTVHHTKDVLLPLFAFGAGLRRDARLKSEFDLDGFDKGDERVYLRFVVNLAEVLDPRNNGDPGKSTFALKLSIDHQRKRGNSEMPSSSRLMVEAAADILKLFNLGDKEKPATTGTKPAALPER